MTDDYGALEDDASFDDESDLIEEIKALRLKLRVHSQLMRKMNYRSLATQVLGAISILGITLALMVGWSNRKAVQSIEDVRDETRLVACVRDNVDTQHDRITLTESLLELVDPGVELTPEQQARVDRYTAKVLASQPYRDCSQPALDDYYKNRPPDPALTDTPP
jgi:hypothetical protein